MYISFSLFLLELFPSAPDNDRENEFFFDMGLRSLGSSLDSSCSDSISSAASSAIMACGFPSANIFKKIHKVCKPIKKYKITENHGKYKLNRMLILTI